MLPYPTLAPSSRAGSPSLKFRESSLPSPLRRLWGHPLALRLRTYRRQHPNKALAIAVSAFVACLWLASRLSPLFGSDDFYDDRAGRGHSPLAWGTHPDAIVNYGDYVGLGHQRAKVLAATPRDYADIGDHYPWLDQQLAGPLYRKRRTRIERQVGALKQDLDEGTPGSGGKKGRGAFERDRHGVLGGASVEWSTGVVGSGTYLGPGVDMVKDSALEEALEQALAEAAADDESDTTAAAESDDLDEASRKPRLRKYEPTSSGAAVSRGERALVERMLEKGWVFLDDDDKVNTERLHADANEHGYLDTLPLRERVRYKAQGRKVAAQGWARVYAAMDTGVATKSALELQLERMVRRVPVVVFSKTTCP